MESVARVVTDKAARLLASPGGLNENLSALAEIHGIELAEIPPGRFCFANVAADVVEKSSGTKYPALHLYCEKFANSLKEKFRTFSGTAAMAVEIRVSQDRLEGIDRALQAYLDAVARVLDQNRGDWGDGVFYAGGYEAAFGAVKHGGRNFLQAGKVTFKVEISLD
jgi:hypothetical protein